MEVFITAGNGLWILASVSFGEGTVFLRAVQKAGYCKIMADTLGKP